MMKTTALIILNYNNAADTEACLRSILRYNTAPVKYIVVDNDSRADEKTALDAAMDRVFGYDGWKALRLGEKIESHVLPSAIRLQTGGNIGYGKGNNAGLNLAYADPEVQCVMILNNDILFVEDIIPDLLNGLETLPDCAIISPVLYKKDLQGYDYNCGRRAPTVSNLVGHNLLHYWRTLRHRTNHDVHPEQYLLDTDSPDREFIEIELPSGSCMLSDKEFFREIGSFDPGTFMYFEENILHRKIASRGKKSYLALNLRCIHLGASTTTRVKDNRWLVQQAINSEKYYVKHYSGASLPMKWLHSASIAFYKFTYLLSKALKK